MTARAPIYALRLQAAPDRDPIRSLKRILKFALRYAGMRALDVREEPEPAVNVSHQPDLFGAPAEPLLGEPAALSIGSIGGLEVHIERPCRHCGATIATIIEGKGPHTAALACACCGGFRQWLSHACCMFLIEFVVRCGRPTEPIRIFEQVNRTT